MCRDEGNGQLSAATATGKVEREREGKGELTSGVGVGVADFLAGKPRILQAKTHVVSTGVVILLLSKI